MRWHREWFRRKVRGAGAGYIPYTQGSGQRLGLAGPVRWACGGGLWMCPCAACPRERTAERGPRQGVREGPAKCKSAYVHVQYITLHTAMDANLVLCCARVRRCSRSMAVKQEN